MTSKTDDIYQALYEEILNSDLEPNQKLHIADLAQKYDVGLSPVREALSRLLSTNLVIALSQRGFIVAPVSLDDLKDLYQTRTSVEKIALALSIEKGDENWEADLLAAFHRLSHTEKKLPITDASHYQQWEKQHRAFNLALISACGLKHLLRIQAQLYQETERYRRLWVKEALKHSQVLPFAEKQKAIMDAALARNTDKALALLEQHFANACQLIGKQLKI